MTDIYVYQGHRDSLTDEMLDAVDAVNGSAWIGRQRQKGPPENGGLYCEMCFRPIKVAPAATIYYTQPIGPIPAGSMHLGPRCRKIIPRIEEVRPLNRKVS